MEKYDEIPLSKHDNGAYKGEMDRLTYSRNMYGLIEKLYEMREGFVEKTSEKEIVNALIREKNNVINNIISLIEERALETINDDWAFNDKDIYNYHITVDNWPKQAICVESLLGYHVGSDPFKYFRNLIDTYLRNKEDEDNNKEILEFSKKVDELRDYKTANEVFEHVMNDLLKIKDI